MTRDAWVAFGSNLGDRLAWLRSGAAELSRRPGIERVRASAIYASRAVVPSEEAGTREDPPFLNAVVELVTVLTPIALLDVLLEIEARHQRRRERRWDPRTLDLDLLYMCEGGQAIVVDAPTLTLPHPRIAGRDFVLRPWADLAPTLTLPGGRTVESLLRELPPSARTIFACEPAALLHLPPSVT